MNDLTTADKITLHRCKNGWMAYKDEGHIMHVSDFFVFESTESLAKNLVKIVGHSGWRIERPAPKRDDKGHFAK